MQLHVGTPLQAAGRSAQVGLPGAGRPPVPALGDATPLHAARQYWFGPQVRSPQPTPPPAVPPAAVVVPAAPFVMDPPLPATDTLPACPPTLLPAQTRHASTRPAAPRLRPPAPPAPPSLMPPAPEFEPPAWLIPPNAAPSALLFAPHAPIPNVSRTDPDNRRLIVRLPHHMRAIAPGTTARAGRSLMPASSAQPVPAGEYPLRAQK